MDLNMMMRDQARLGLQTQLDTAVTNGDTAAATKIADDIAKLAVSTAPKALAYGDIEIKAQLDKQPWFGIDPKKSARVIELGKHMDPKKFATAEAFAAALVKAVDDEAKPAVTTQDPPENETDDEREEREAAEAEAAETAAAAKKTRKTDAPGEADAGTRGGTRRTSGPWTKMTDAPADVQKEVKRSMGKLLSSNATKEAREKFTTRALESHHAAFIRNKGKK